MLIDPFAAPFILGSYFIFLHTVTSIGKSNDSPEEAYSELQKASSLATLEIVASFRLNGMAESAEDARIVILDMFMIAISWIFELTLG